MDTLPLPRMARLLGVTSKWLRSEADAGRLPCVKAGRRYIFEPQAVQAELARRAASERLGSPPVASQDRDRASSNRSATI